MDNKLSLKNETCTHEKSYKRYIGLDHSEPYRSFSSLLYEGLLYCLTNNLNMKKYAFATLFLSIPLWVNSGQPTKDLIHTPYETTLTYQRTKEEINKQLQKLYNLSYEKDKKIELLNNLNLDITKHFTQEERDKVTIICKALGIKEEYLYKIMHFECGFNHIKSNPYSHAMGLIQFLPSTAISLGTTVEDLAKMSKLEQLNYVYKYFEPICKRYKLLTYCDVHLAVFNPTSLGKNINTIIGSNLSTIYLQNKILDTNQDGQITIKDIKNYTKT